MQNNNSIPINELQNVLSQYLTEQISEHLEQIVENETSNQPIFNLNNNSRRRRDMFQTDNRPNNRTSRINRLNRNIYTRNNNNRHSNESNNTSNSNSVNPYSNLLENLNQQMVEYHDNMSTYLSIVNEFITNNNLQNRLRPTPIIQEVNNQRPLYNNTSNLFSTRNNNPSFSSSFNTNPFLPRNNSDLFTSNEQVNNTNNNTANNRNMSTTTEPIRNFSFNFLPPGMNSPLFRNVIVRPSEQQIEAASETLEYNENEILMNNQCPISLEDFRNGDRIRRIRYCGHCFSETSFNTWFNSNVRCPICRHDIRDNIITTDSSNNATISRNNSNLEESLSGIFDRLEAEERNNHIRSELNNQIQSDEDASTNTYVSTFVDSSNNLALRLEIPLQYTASFDSSNNLISSSGTFV